MALIVLAATAEVQFRHGSLSPKKQYSKVLSKLDAELGIFPTSELLASRQMIVEGKKNRFFWPVDPKSPKLIPSLRGMAWDLSHVRSMLQWNAENSRLANEHADFIIPYFISFDRGLSSIIEYLRPNGLIYQRDGESARFIQIYGPDVLELNTDLIDEQSEMLLGTEARAKRKIVSRQFSEISRLEALAEMYVDRLKHT